MPAAARSAGGADTFRILATAVDQPLAALLATGLGLGGADYIFGGFGEFSRSLLFPPSTTTGFLYDQTLFGGAGADTIFGNEGDDTIDGGSGADSFDGGVGVNTLSFETATGPSYAHLGLAQTGDGDTIVNFRNLTGSPFNDTLAGDANANVISGGGGNDLFAGGAGADTVNGGAGNDTVYVEAGPDSLIGGDGFDILNFELSATGRVVPQYQATLPDGTSIAGFEGAIGSNFADTIYGTAETDAISGGRGADVILLGGGVDCLNIAAADIVAGEFDYIADLQAGDLIFAPAAFPFFVFSFSGPTCAIANAHGGGYWGMGFGGGATVATVQAAIAYN